MDVFKCFKAKNKHSVNNVKLQYNYKLLTLINLV